MKRLLLLSFLLLPILANAQNWSGILAPARAIDWSGAGVVGGVPNVTTVCATLNPGATVSQIQSAINACSSGVVVLNAGTYALAGGLAMKTNVVVRGAGADLTRLNFTANGVSACNIPGNEDVCFAGSSNWSGGNDHSTTWTAGYAQGATSITLGSTAGLAVGQILILDQQDDTADTGNYFVNGGSTAFSTEAGSPGRFIGGVLAAQQEYKLVTAISGSTVTISPGLYSPNWRSAKNPGAWWANTTIRNAGLENLTLDHSVSGTGSTSFVLSGTAFVNAYNCWYKGVRSIYAIGSGNGGRDHILLQTSNHITIRDSYFYGTRNNGNLSYGVETYMTGDDLVENNIFQFIDAPLLVGNSEGSVFGYNFGVNMYNNNATFNFPGPPFTHDAGTAYNLFEGNQGTGGLEDDIHGTHNMHTYFRNQYFARDDAAKVTQIQAIEVSSYARYMAYVGNVLGQGGVSNKYQVIAPDTVNCNTAIFSFGFQSSGCSNSLDAALVSSTAMRWGNYDTVNNAVRFVASEVPSGLSLFPVAVPSSQTLPASFYRSAVKPVWWGTMPYPAVGPDVSGGTLVAGSSTLGGHAYPIPARACYLNVMGGPANGSGAVLSFNANNCYPASAPPTPQVALSAATLAFGNQQIGTTGANQTDTLTNSGTGNLIISAIALGGTNPTDFSQSSTCGPLPLTLISGASCLFTANFHPAAVGAKSGQISITDNATGSPHVIALSGTGINPLPTATFNPASLSFAARNTGTTSAGQSATLTNSGSANLVVSAVALAGTNSGDFAQVNNCGATPFTLTPGASCSFTSVTFSPTAINGRSASISVTDNATGSPHLLALTGTGLNPGISFNPTSIAFGNQIVNTQSSGSTLVVTSSGSTSLTISAVSITGANANQFSQTNTCVATLTSGSTCTATVRFLPTTAGAKTASLSFTDTANSSPHTVALTGTGITGSATVTLLPATVAFPNTLVGVASPPQTVQLSNTGTLNVTVSSVSTGISDFSQSNNCPGTLVPGQNCLVTLTFLPSTTGARTGTLTVTDSATGSPHTSALSGNGIAPGASISPASIAFGNQTATTSSANQTVTFTNNGTAQTHFTSVTLTGADPTHFTLTNSGASACLGTLNVGASCSVLIAFSPATAGAKTASISFADDAPASPQTVSLTGTGIATQPAVTLAPTSLTFGAQQVLTSSATKTVVLTNSGLATLTVSSINASGDFSNTTTCGGTVAASGTCNIVVTFTPTISGTRTGAITITDSAAGSPHVVPLTGTGTPAPAPSVSLSLNSLTYTAQQVGTSSSAQVVTLTNNGTATLNISGYSFTGANGTDFTQTHTCGATVAAAASCTISITFSPLAAGTRVGTLNIADDAAGNPHQVSLTGTAFNGTPGAQVSPNVLTFPNTRRLVSSAPLNVTFSNPGTAALLISGISISGDFSQTNTCGSSLAPAASCTVSVVFTPTVTGTLTGTLTFTDNAASSPQTVALSGHGAGPKVKLSATAVSFPDTIAGQTSPDPAVVLTNEGDATLAISSVTVSTAQFAVANGCPVVLAPGGSCSLTATFTPSSAGAKTANLVIADDASDSPQSVALSGTALAAFPVVTLTPASLDFGSIQSGSTSAAKTIQIKNTGTSLLSVSSITKTGTNSANYALTNPCGASFTLAVNATCTLSITVTPSATGTRVAQINVNDDASDTPQVAPMTVLSTAAPAPAVTLSAASLTFGNQQTGTSSAAQPLTLTNSGDATLNISGIAIVGTNAVDFSKTSTCAATVAAGANCSISLTFSPLTAGSKTATVQISDDAASTPQSFTLVGTAFAGAPGATLSLSSLSYPNQVIFTSSLSKSVTLTNNGAATLSISAIGITGDFAQSNTCGTVPTTLATGNSCTLTVIFTPTVTGARTGTLSITDNASGSPQTVSLSGTGDPTPPPPSDATAVAIGGHARIGGHAVFGVQLAPPLNAYSSCILPTTLQTPSAPSFGGRLGMNTVVADPEPANGSTCLHNPIVRLTDSNFDPSQPNRTLFSGCDGSADDVTMNADSSLLTVCNTGGRSYPMTFNSSTLQVARMYVSSNAATGGMFIGQQGFWSRTNPLLYYTVQGTQLKGTCFGTSVTSGNCNGPIDLTNTPTAGNGRIYVVFNFATGLNCLPSGFTPTWTGIGKESALDQVFSLGYSSTGAQNTGVIVAVYSVGLGCSILNTSTGQITSDWGTTGTINISDRFTLHNVEMSKSGAYIVLGIGSCLSTCSNGPSPYAWQVGTNNVFPLAPAGQKPSGHFTEGYDHWINNPGSPLQYSFYDRPFSNVNGWVLMDPSIPNTVVPVLDSHPSWNNADVSDSTPVMNSSWTSKTSYPGPYYNEIDGLSPSGGTIYRFAHSFITGQSQRFETQFGIGQSSQDGKFFIFASDMLGTLGSESGSSTCTVGTNCRGDAFIVKLQ